MTTKRRRAVLSAIGIGALVVSTVLTVPATAGLPSTYRLQLDARAPVGESWSFLRFFPRELSVHPGDVVNAAWAGPGAPHTATAVPSGNVAAWVAENQGPRGPQDPSEFPWALMVPDTTVGGDEGETIANPAVAGPTDPTCGAPEDPCEFDGTSVVNSGLQFATPGAQPSFHVEVTAPVGEYAFVCLLHPGMQADLHVVGQKEAVPPPAEVALQTSMQVERAREVDGPTAEALAQTVKRTHLPSGHTRLTMWAGGFWRQVSADEFPEDRIKAHVGDRLKVLGNFEIHTATFPAASGARVPFISTQCEEEGPDAPGASPADCTSPADFQIVFNPQAVLPTANDSLRKPRRFVNSGLITWPDSHVFVAKRPGDYDFVCLVHPGMFGSIRVARGLTTALPNSEAGDAPAVMGELHYLSATEALALFSTRELSPVELTRAVIARAEQVEPSVNALGVRLFDEALIAAERAERTYARDDARPRPLEGIPVAIKEEMAVAGQRTTQGSLAYADDVSDHSAVVAQRVVDAGSIVHARSNAPEFSCAGFTHSRLWGITRNPWNLDFSPGGSSGGSAASLAAGTTTLATGSDLGGSIRVPASCCGVVGFKPTYGRVPVEPPFNLDHWCHEGPMARTVADCALLFDVLSGPDASDVTTLRPKLRVGSVLHDGIRGWRIALSTTLGDFEVDEDVVANARAAADVFREAGATVEEVDLRWRRRDIVQAALIHFGAVLGPSIQREVDDHRELLTSYAMWFAENASRITKEQYLPGLEIESRVCSELGAVLEGFDILICPTVAVPALEAGREYLDAGPMVNGVQLDHVYEILMTLPFNICSRCPAMSVPSGFAANGVPTGLQIVGRTYEDADVFRAAAAYEKVRPWFGSEQDRPSL